MPYTYRDVKNSCDTQCNIASKMPICNNMNNHALVDSWRHAGNKIILSFGGADIGGSWSGTLSFALVYGTGVYLFLKVILKIIISISFLQKHLSPYSDTLINNRRSK